MVRGYHVYKDVWDPFVNDTLVTKHERDNTHDKYAVAVIADDMKTRTVVGNLPKEISKISCLFILRGAEITGKVTGARGRTRGECGGKEIPCELTFSKRR